MTSLAEFIPIELINHILSYRPRHPDAELIKQFKKNLFEKLYRMYRDDNKNYSILTFKELNYLLGYYDKIFSSEIIPNCIYRMKTKKYKDSVAVYWGKYYTDKIAIQVYNNYTDIEWVKNHNYQTIIELVTIDNNTLEENMVERTEYYESEKDNTDSEYESEEEEEIDYIEPKLVEAKNNLKKIK